MASANVAHAHRHSVFHVALLGDMKGLRPEVNDCRTLRGISQNQLSPNT